VATDFPGPFQPRLISTVSLSVNWFQEVGSKGISLSSKPKKATSWAIINGLALQCQARTIGSPSPVTVDEPVKSQNPDGFEKSSISRRANLEE
jgi:hypothetical protein